MGFILAMDDDFNTCKALGEIFDFVADVNARTAGKTLAITDVPFVRDARALVVDLLGVLGVDVEAAAQEAEGTDGAYPAEVVGLAAEMAGYEGEDAAEAVDALLAVRSKARAAKDCPAPMPCATAFQAWASPSRTPRKVRGSCGPERARRIALRSAEAFCLARLEPSSRAGKRASAGFRRLAPLRFSLASRTSERIGQTGQTGHPTMFERNHTPELLAPAGGRAQLEAAVRFGRGRGVLRVRTASGCASARRTSRLTRCRRPWRCAHASGARAYVALNTLMDADDVAALPATWRRSTRLARTRSS